jgi:hypothetical protein
MCKVLAIFFISPQVGALPLVRPNLLIESRKPKNSSTCALFLIFERKPFFSTSANLGKK